MVRIKLANKENKRGDKKMYQFYKENYYNIQ